MCLVEEKRSDGESMSVGGRAGGSIYIYQRAVQSSNGGA